MISSKYRNILHKNTNNKYSVSMVILDCTQSEWAVIYCYPSPCFQQSPADCTRGKWKGVLGLLKRMATFPTVIRPNIKWKTQEAKLNSKVNVLKVLLWMQEALYIQELNTNVRLSNTSISCLDDWCFTPTFVYMVG